MRVGVVIFPGSNCDRDCLGVSRRVMGWETIACWHRESLPDDLDLVILPGGFSHGDHLRAGALAALAAVMRDVIAHAKRGGLVLGICNGFQVLCETGLLPGALRINRGLRFICEDVWLRVERRDTAFTSAIPDRAVRFPIAHREGNYFAKPDTLKRLEDNGQVLFRYADAEGNVSEASNPNGSVNGIAGIMNEAGNVCGLMPHPERLSEDVLGGTDGLAVFESLRSALGAAL